MKRIRKQIDVVTYHAFILGLTAGTAITLLAVVITL
jgi:hypothetical protein